MAGRKLVATVHVHRDDGSTAVYGPGDDVPAADAKLIANDDAWESKGTSSKSDGDDSK